MNRKIVIGILLLLLVLVGAFKVAAWQKAKQIAQSLPLKMQLNVTVEEFSLDSNSHIQEITIDRGVITYRSVAYGPFDDPPVIKKAFLTPTLFESIKKQIKEAGALQTIEEIRTEKATPGNWIDVAFSVDLEGEKGVIKLQGMTGVPLEKDPEKVILKNQALADALYRLAFSIANSLQD